MFWSADYMRGRAAVESERAMDEMFASAFRARRPAIAGDRAALVAHIAQLQAQLQRTCALLEQCAAERKEFFDSYRDEHVAHQATLQQLAMARGLLVFSQRTSDTPP